MEQNQSSDEVYLDVQEIESNPLSKDSVKQTFSTYEPQPKDPSSSGCFFKTCGCLFLVGLLIVLSTFWLIYNIFYQLILWL